MSSENDREERTDDDLDGDEAAAAASAPEEAAAPDPATPRNRAERRAVAKAARRGRQAVLADGAAQADAGEQLLDPEGNLLAPTTSMGGNPISIPDAPGPKRPRVPPRTMSKGTGDVEGVPEWARRFGDTFSQKRGAIVTGVLVALTVFGGVYGFQAFRAKKAAGASDALVQALDAFAAPAQRGEGAEPPRFGPSFASDDERLRETSTRFRRVTDQHGDARVAPLARLGLASTLYLQGRYDEARPIFQSLLGRDVAGLEAQALEGLGFTLESQNDLDGALQRFRELQAIEDGAYRDQAQFYQARVFVRRNDSERAKELLRQVVERIGRAAAADPAAVASMSLRDQAFAMLREVAPTDPLVLQRDRDNAPGPGGDAHEGEGATPGGLPAGLPPELLRQLREQMRRTKQGG